jgi:nitroreductase
MDFRDLVLRTRSYRRFVEAEPIEAPVLESLVDLARQTASARNAQPLKYVLSVSREMNAEIFGCLAWAGYLKDWPGPVEGERPSGYVVLLGDNRIAKEIDCDHGIAAQTIMLGATALGLGGCMLSNVSRAKLAPILGLGEEYRIILVLALGKPAETVLLDPLGPDGDIKYWRDEQQVHHTPKRALADIIVGKYV